MKSLLPSSAFSARSLAALMLASFALIAVAACSSSESAPGVAPDGGHSGSSGQAGVAGDGGRGGQSAAGGQGDTGGGGGDSGEGGSVEDSGVDGGGDGSPETTTPTTLEGACREAVKAQCARERVCLGTFGTVSVEGAEAFCLSRAELCPDYYFADGSNRTFEEILACLATLRQLPCTDLAIGAIPSCLKSGNRTPGQRCLFGSQCTSSVCNGGNMLCGACAAVPGAAENCQVSSSGPFCPAGQFCNLANRRCSEGSTVVYGGEGAMCDLAAEPVRGCEGDLLCNTFTETPGICQRIPREGEPCAYTGIGNRRVCGRGLECSGAADGGLRCIDLNRCGTALCDANSYCKRDGGTEICAPRSTEGGPCTPTGGLPHLDSGCDATTYCSRFADSGMAGVCVKAVIPGGRGDGCATTGNCGSPFTCQNGRCAPFPSLQCAPQ